MDRIEASRGKVKRKAGTVGVLDCSVSHHEILDETIELPKVWSHGIDDQHHKLKNKKWSVEYKERF